MAIVMDMCSGEVEMRFTSDANQGGQSLLSALNPALKMPEVALSLVAHPAETRSEQHSIPAFLMSMDIDVFLQSMNKHL